MLRFALLALSIAVPPLAARGSTDVDDGPPLGRVAEVQGRLLVRGAYDEERILITRNAVVPPGDELAAPIGSFAELELEGGSFVRLAGGTTVTLDRVDGVVLVALQTGAVSASRGEEAGPLSVVALGARVALDAPAEVRVSLDQREMRSTVRVVSGEVDLLDGDGSETLHAGQMLTRVPGSTRHATWDRQPDAFDNWIERRRTWYAKREAPRALAHGRYLGTYDLAGAGEWIVVSGQRAWRPFVAARWRPYHSGRWSWTAPYGWVWVPAARWGYVTHHYGRWTFTQAHGWVWLPDPVWGPAWVAWAGVGPYVGWAPLGPGGRAVFITEISHPYDPLVWIFADFSYFYHGGGGFCRTGRSGDRFETLGHDVILSLETYPIDDPDDDLAPGSHGKREPWSRAGRRATAIGDRTRGGKRPALATRSRAAEELDINAPRRARRRGQRAAGEATASLGRSPFDRSRTQAANHAQPARPRVAGNARRSLSVTIGSSAARRAPVLAPARAPVQAATSAHSDIVPAATRRANASAASAPPSINPPSRPPDREPATTEQVVTRQPPRRETPTVQWTVTPSPSRAAPSVTNPRRPRPSVVRPARPSAPRRYTAPVRSPTPRRYTPPARSPAPKRVERPNPPAIRHESSKASSSKKSTPPKPSRSRSSSNRPSRHER
jgi:hypothetical protein